LAMGCILNGLIPVGSSGEIKNTHKTKIHLTSCIAKKRDRGS